MAIKYLAGDRLQGTAAERAALLGGVDKANLKAYYTMDEASGDLINTASSVGSSHAISNFNLSPTAGSGTITQNVTGKLNKCVTFSGNASAQADDSNLADTAFISNTGAVFTMCLWVKVATRAGDQAYITTSDLTVGANGLFFRMQDTSGHIYCKFGSQGATLGGTTSSTVIPNDAGWHFVVAQYDYQVGTTYISVDNGTLESVATGETISTTTTPQDKLHLGNTPFLDNDLNGELDDVSIWNRILTAAEITSIYNSGTGATLASLPLVTLNLPNGAIFEESDGTGKHYMWDGTSAWNETK